MNEPVLSTSLPSSTGYPLDLSAIRAQFPILQEKVHGHDLVYLDNGASSQKPLKVTESLQRYYATQHANVHRGVHALSDRATEAYENARRVAGRFINARQPEEIIFVRGTTEGLNLVAEAYGRHRLTAGDEILVSEMEHHSNIVPWQLIAERTGSVVRMIPMNDRGEIIMEQYSALLNDKTRVVAISYVANSLGTVNPIKEMTEMAHAAGAVVVVDAAQAAPHLKLDVVDLDCDFLAFSGHKMYAPTGIGVLYGKAALLDAMPPYQGGGEMIQRVTFAGSTYAEIPHKFEAGTPNVADAVGLAAACEFMWEIGMDALAAHECHLLEYTERKARDLGGLRVFGNAAHKAGVFAFTLNDIHAHDVGTILDRKGVAIRVGHHCAMPVMQHFNVAATARATFAVYNTYEEIDRMFEALTDAKKLFGC